MRSDSLVRLRLTPHDFNHTQDVGSVVLLDARFAGLSKWFRVAAATPHQSARECCQFLENSD